jgi:hypothetical protein
MNSGKPRRIFINRIHGSIASSPKVVLEAAIGREPTTKGAAGIQLLDIDE